MSGHGDCCWLCCGGMGFGPYRYAGQRHTTVMARVSRGFVEQTLWPEFLELDEVLRRYLEETTERVIREGWSGQFGGGRTQRLAVIEGRGGAHEVLAASATCLQ